MRTTHLIMSLMVFFGACTGFVFAEEAENLTPKRRLTPSQTEKVERLKKEIASEIVRLKQFEAPLNDITKQISDLEIKHTKYMDSIESAIDLIHGYSNNPKSVNKETPKKIAEAIAPAEDVSKKFLKIAMSLIKLQGEITKIATNISPDGRKAKKQHAKVKKMRENADELWAKIEAMKKKLNEDYREQTNELTDKRREADETYYLESQKLIVNRTNLMLILGYEATGGALMFTDEAMDGGDDLKAITWIEAQSKFIQRLSLYGHDELAINYLNKITREPNPYTNKPFSDDSKTSLGKIGAKLKLSKALNTTDLAQKLTIGYEALTIYKQVADNLTPQSPTQIDATNDLLTACVRIAEDLANTAIRNKLLTGRPMPDLIKPSLEDEYIEGPAKPVNLPFFDPATVKGKKDDNLNDIAIKMANTYYTFAEKASKANNERFPEIWMDIVDEYLIAKEDGNSAKERIQNKLINRFSSRKLDLQHATESLYASWPSIFPPNSPTRNGLADKGRKYTEKLMNDYESIFFTDLNVYYYLMGMNSQLIDPVLEKGKDGKPIPVFDDSYMDEMSEEEQAQEKKSISRYIWPSKRIEMIYKYKIIKKPGTVKDPVQQARRVKGLLYYAKALTAIAKSHYTYAQTLSGADKTKMLAHADKLNKNAISTLKSVSGSGGFVGEIDEATANKIRLEIGLEYYLFLASNALKNGNKDLASEYGSLAVSEAAAVRVKGGAWGALSSEYLSFADKFNQKNDIGVGDDPESWSVVLLASKASELVKQGLVLERSGNISKSQTAYREARFLFWILLEKTKNIKDKDQREQILLKSLYELGTASTKIGDYTTAVITYQQIAQEFGNHFADPSMNYDPAIYANAAKYYEKALNNLKAAAFKRQKLTGADYDKRNYITALLINVRHSGKGSDYAQLINTMQKMRQFESAIQFIDNVPSDNNYYRMIQLLASSIYISMIQEDVTRINEIDELLYPTPDDNGEIPEDLILSADNKKSLESEKASLQKNIHEYRKEANKYAMKFINGHKKALKTWAEDQKNGVAVLDSVKEIRKSEMDRLPLAMLIPIKLATESQDWAEVRKLAPAYLKDIDKQETISEEDKQNYRETAAWMMFIAQVKSTDYKKDEIAKCVANLREAESVQKELEKWDKSNKYQSTAASLLGSAWMKLANRSEKAGNTANEQEYSLNSVNWFDKAERRIYSSAPLGIIMANTLTEQKLYERAEKILDKVVGYWGESLFTEKSLWADGKSKADFKAASQVTGALGSVFNFSKISSSASSGDKELIAELNSQINSVPVEGKLDVYSKAVAAAEQLYKDDKEMLKSLEQAKEIIAGYAKPNKDVERLADKKPYLPNKPTVDQQDRLKRIMLEASFPALYRMPTIAIIPAAKDVLMQTYLLTRSELIGKAGELKKAVLMAMIDPDSVIGKSAGKLVFGKVKGKKDGKGGYYRQLTQKLKTEKDAAKIESYKAIIATLDTPLIVSLYGMPDPKKPQGKLIKRNYARAAYAIKTILDYNESTLPDTELELTSFLKKLANALVFQNTLLAAKKNYAKAMVENGQYSKAEKYVKQLSNLFPQDWTLTLDLSKIYTMMARYKIVDGKPVARDYNKEVAQLFLQGKAQANSVKAAPGSKAYWAKKVAVFTNSVESLEARNKSGKFNGEFKVVYELFNPTTGKTRKIDVTIDKLSYLGAIDASDIQRLLSEEPAADIAAKLEALAVRLEAIGFKANKIEDDVDFKIKPPAPESEKKDTPKEKGAA